MSKNLSVLIKRTKETRQQDAKRRHRSDPPYSKVYRRKPVDISYSQMDRAFVGVADGAPVGLLVGFLVGLFVGLLVGLLVGRFVGRFVGLLVGLLVGRFVGLLVGRFVGDRVGAWVGGFVSGAGRQTDVAL